MAILARFRSRSLILLYHRVARVEPDVWSLCVSPANFTEHLEVLRRYQTVRLDQLGPGGWFKGRGLTCAVTFDDGYADNLHQAKRWLRRFAIPCTFFIATGYIDSGREFWWDELERYVYQADDPAALVDILPGSGPSTERRAVYMNLYETLQSLPHVARTHILDRMKIRFGKDTSPRESHRVLTSKELTELATSDQFEIGAHTVTHPLLAAQPPETQFEELQGSKTWLEDRVGRRVTSVSYPYGGTGHYTRATVQAARRAGFDRACTTTPVDVTRSSSPWELGRVTVPDVGGEAFERLLLGIS
jgi:peptidoglycan/xylan/chitin deacetylase (PgdA/CDA1 family)